MRPEYKFRTRGSYALTNFALQATGIRKNTGQPFGSCLLTSRCFRGLCPLHPLNALYIMPHMRTLGPRPPSMLRDLSLVRGADCDVEAERIPIPTLMPTAPMPPM